MRKLASVEIIDKLEPIPSMIKIPVETFEKLNFNNCNYRIYVKESLI